jgi:hypothetical protein
MILARYMIFARIRFRSNTGTNSQCKFCDCALHVWCSIEGQSVGPTACYTCQKCHKKGTVEKRQSIQGSLQVINVGSEAVNLDSPPASNTHNRRGRLEAWSCNADSATPVWEPNSSNPESLEEHIIDPSTAKEAEGGIGDVCTPARNRHHMVQNTLPFDV